MRCASRASWHQPGPAHEGRPHTLHTTNMCAWRPHAPATAAVFLRPCPIHTLVQRGLPASMAAAVAPTPAAPGTDSLDADSFRKLYPQAYHQKFLDDGIRHTGRIVGRARETAITLGTITSADGSSLVKQGETTVLAGVRLAISRPSDTAPDCGSVTINVEVAAFSSAALSLGRSSELVGVTYDRLQQVLLGGSAAGRTGCLPLQQLCIENGKAAWALTLDVYILNIDGAVQDAALLAAVAALLNTQLPATLVSPEGHVTRRGAQGTGADGPEAMDTSDAAAQDARQVVLDAVPLSLTCALYKGLALVDPDNEEEDALASSLVTVVVDQHQRLHGVFKQGGEPASRSDMLLCIESAKMRYKEVWELLQQAQQPEADDEMGS